MESTLSLSDVDAGRFGSAEQKFPTLLQVVELSHRGLVSLLYNFFHSITRTMEIIVQCRAFDILAAELVQCCPAVGEAFVELV